MFKRILLAWVLACLYAPLFAQTADVETPIVKSSERFSELFEPEPDDDEGIGRDFFCWITWPSGTVYSISGNGYPDTVEWCVYASEPAWIYIGGTDPDGSQPFVFTGEKTPHCFSYTLQPGQEGTYTRYALVSSCAEPIRFCITSTTTHTVYP